MGDLHVNGTVFGEDRPYSSSPPSPPLPVMNPDPSFIAEEAWSAAEITTAEILRRIQPTLAADRRRRDVVHYVQRLIRFGARCEVMFLLLRLFVNSLMLLLLLGFCLFFFEFSTLLALFDVLRLL